MGIRVDFGARRERRAPCASWPSESLGMHPAPRSEIFRVPGYMSAVPSCSLSAATRAVRQALAYPDTFCAPSAPVRARREGSAVANQIEGPD